MDDSNILNDKLMSIPGPRDQFGVGTCGAHGTGKLLDRTFSGKRQKRFCIKFRKCDQERKVSPISSVVSFASSKKLKI